MKLHLTHDLLEDEKMDEANEWLDSTQEQVTAYVQENISDRITNVRCELDSTEFGHITVEADAELDKAELDALSDWLETSGYDPEMDEDMEEDLDEDMEEDEDQDQLDVGKKLAFCFSQMDFAYDHYVYNNVEMDDINGYEFEQVSGPDNRLTLTDADLAFADEAQMVM